MWSALGYAIYGLSYGRGRVLNSLWKVIEYAVQNQKVKITFQTGLYRSSADSLHGLFPLGFRLQNTLCDVLFFIVFPGN